jgi:hypothetical protein
MQEAASREKTLRSEKKSLEQALAKRKAKIKKIGVCLLLRPEIFLSES